MAPSGQAPIGRPHLTILIPAYNEAERIAETLDRIAVYVDRTDLAAEVVVIDDGSSDATSGVATARLKGRRGRVLRNPENRGKGFTVRRGVLEAAGRWVLLTDADLSTPIEEHARLAEVARDRDVDVVIGSRGLPDSRVEVPQHTAHRWMGKTFNVLSRALTGLPYRDTQCGFKLMDRERVRPVFERMVIDRFAFDVELLFLCDRLGLSVVEVPVTWRDSPGSTVNVWTAPWSMMLDVVRVRWGFRRGRYSTAPGDDRGGGQ